MNKSFYLVLIFTIASVALIADITTTIIENNNDFQNYKSYIGYIIGYI
jgi:hypothetical protein